MLRLRILTAVVLLLVLAAALLAPSPWPFIVLIAAACALAGREWLRMTAGVAGTVRWVNTGVAGGVFFLIILQALLTTGQQAAATMLTAPLAAMAWLLIAPLMVIRARVDAPARSLALSLFAVLALGATGLALVLMFLTRGAWYVVSLLMLVWVADVAAYFAGRACGRRKLAPRVSPGKSVEGAVAGVVAVVVWVLASGQYEASYGHALIARWGAMATVPLAALLAVMSILGDLFESLIKRRAGVKDSSGLLPGHGGVWDRVDAVLPVVPLAALLVGF